MRLRDLLYPLLGCLALAACASSPGPDTCTIEVVGVEKAEMSPGDAEFAYRVRGYAGSRGTVWLAAKLRPGDYLSGPGLEVGPGPFEAIVDLSLTGKPPGFVVVLDIGGRRCRAEP